MGKKSHPKVDANAKLQPGTPRLSIPAAMFIVSASCLLLLWGYFWRTSHGIDNFLDIGDVKNWKRPSPGALPLDPAWGSWKPGLYFGIRSQHYPAFISTGMMWGKAASSLVRHAARQDEITLFEWLRHDGERYGKHRVLDAKLHTEINSTFSIPKESHNASWAQRFDMRSSGDPLSFYFYFGLDCDGNLPDKSCLMETPTEFEEVFQQNSANSLIVRGKNKISGSFEIHFDLSANSDGQISFWAAPRQTLPYVLKRIEERFSVERRSKNHDIFKNDSSGAFMNHWSRNTSAFAIHVAVTGNASLDVLFRERVDIVENSVANCENLEAIDKQILISSWIQEFESNFDQKYRLSYGSSGADLNAHETEMSKKIISAVLGGVGLFMGHPHIGNASDAEIHSPFRASSSEENSYIQLLSGTPSRTSFPRGFLWDEGFHLMISSQWSIDLGISIISSWLKSMFTLSFSIGTNGELTRPNGGSSGSHMGGEMGWIPRELILGRDALSVVPEEFVLQRVDIANPPTLLLVIERMIDQINQIKGRASCDDANQPISCSISDEQMENAKKIKSFLMESYPALCNWLKWFFITQRGPPHTPGSFRWRGRSSSDGKLLANTLASGLDDYPRAFFPTKDEYHVDLLCWIAKFSSVMAKIDAYLEYDSEIAHAHFFSVLPEFVNEKDVTGIYSAKNFADLASELSKSLEKFHWSEAHQLYADVGLHSEEGRIVEEFVYRCLNPATRDTADIGLPRSVLFSKNQDMSKYCPNGFSRGYPLGGSNNGYLSREKYAVKKGSEKVQHVPHAGYVSLYPLLLKLIPTDSPKLSIVLDLVENKLLTPFGLRSLATGNKFYGKSNAPGDNPYWRGYIWLNINYLAVAALKHYEKFAESQDMRRRCALLCETLRKNLVTNVIREYERTGYLWEQYSDETGKGIRGHPFSGWTALVVNLLSETF